MFILLKPSVSVMTENTVWGPSHRRDHAQFEKNFEVAVPSGKMLRIVIISRVFCFGSLIPGTNPAWTNKAPRSLLERYHGRLYNHFKSALLRQEAIWKCSETIYGMDDKSKKSRSNLIAIDPREKKYAATALTIGGSAPDMIAWCQRITEHQSKERTGRDEKACNGA